MYTVGVRGSLRVLHNLRGQSGEAPPGGRRYDVIVEVESRELDLEGSALDAALLRERVAETLAELDARELASLPAFEGVVPTAELLARHIHHQLSKRFPVVAGFPIIRGSNLSVTLDEPGFAWIRYAAPVRGPALPRTARR